MRIPVFIILITTGINFCDCAKESGKLGRIVRGHNAVVGQFPYVVRLAAKIGEIKMGCAGCITCINAMLCGGALISPNWVLTAAHCVINAESVKVHLGSISRYRAKVVYDVPTAQIKIHQRFNRRNGHNDISLIKIPLTKLCKAIGIVPLPKVGSSVPKYDGAYATACGWGQRSDRGDSSRILQWGRFQILPSEKCRFMDIIESQMCTITSPDFATINCGDSGGPLVLESTGELVGIVSTADIGNCDNGQPPVFTRVTSYLNWIESISGICY